MSLANKPQPRRVTIDHDESTSSSSVDLTANTVVGLRVLGGWTSAAITFEAKAEGTDDWLTLRDADGLVEVADPGGAAHIALDPSRFASVRFLRIRSGTPGSFVAQTPGAGEQRALDILVRSVN